MADDWLGISSTEYDSSCGAYSAGYDVPSALDGTSYWYHPVDEVHWFILDLGQTYTIKKVRGRSDLNQDPRICNVFVSDSKVSWGDAVGSTTTEWEDTIDWVELDTTDKDGRYIKIEIETTEDAGGAIGWGNTTPPFTIFDAYGDVAAPPPPAGTTGDLGLALGLGPGGGRVGATGSGSRIPHLDEGLGMKRHPRSRVH